jgi:hypothetical protein
MGTIFREANDKIDIEEKPRNLLQDKPPMGKVSEPLPILSL